MSIYEVDRVSRDVLHDPDFRDRVLADPGAALSERELNEVERSALLAGDVGRLYLLGANAYLMGNLFRFGAFGLTLENFNERMRAVAGQASVGQH